MLRLPDPSLVLLVGPSASGKSSWAAEHFRPEQVVSSDQLRAVVGESEGDLSASADAFAVLEQIVTARIGRRLTTVIDTLGLDADRRRRWRELAAAHRVHSVAVTFDTPAAVCRSRNATRQRRLPATVLTGQLKQFGQVRPGLDGEGFDQVIAAEPVRVVPPTFAAAAAGARSEPAAVPKPIEDDDSRDDESRDDGSRDDESRDDELKFGLQLSSFTMPGGPPVIADRLSQVARDAEAAGFSSIWVMDHFRQIPQVGRPWEDLLESTAALGYLAAATTTASIGCLVNCVTYRNLGHLAKIVATLDVLSSGRAWCGLGAGWFEAEHLGYGYPFRSARERLDLLEDALQALPMLWGPGQPGFRGSRVSIPETLCYPRPLRSPVPLLVGGSGERRTLRLVARYADACNLTGQPDVVRRKLAVLAGHCAEAGRDPATVQVTHLSTALVARDEAELERELAVRRPARNAARWAARTNPGTVEDHVLRARALQQAGVQQVIVSLEGIWDSPAVERFGQVIAAFRGSPSRPS